MWTTLNMALALMFGVLHQGGAAPPLLSVQSTLGNAVAGSSRAVYWKIIRHLCICLTCLDSSRVCDPSTWRQETQMSCPETCLSWTFWRTTMAALPAPSFDSTYPVTPVYLTFPQGIPSWIVLKRLIFLHLDLARIRGSMQGGGFTPSNGVVSLLVVSQPLSFSALRRLSSAPRGHNR